MKSLSKFQKGFTLIELLIVIAVLGVLAAVVLVAIDPIQQLARGRDSGRVSTVAQLGHAMQAYFTAQNLTTWPAVSTTWQTTLQSSGEIANTYTAPSGAAGCQNSANQGNYCYAPSGTGGVVWTFLEAKTNIDRAAGPGATQTACAAGSTAAVVYSTTQGKAGLTCVTTGGTPSDTATLY